MRMERLATPLALNCWPLMAVSRPPKSLSSNPGDLPGISKGVKSKAIRALIVDDEPIARRVLREELEIQPDIEIAGEADNGSKALAAGGEDALQQLARTANQEAAGIERFLRRRQGIQLGGRRAFSILFLLRRLFP